jgi:tetratricopeptide (TPR) repeat protein
MAVLRKMMKLEPSNPYYYSSLGDFYLERANRHEALKAYEQSVRLLPKLQEHPFLSVQEISSDILQAAIRGAEQALAEGSREVPEHLLRRNLSELYGKAGDWRGAIQHMERACALQPRRIWYQFRLASLYFQAGELDRSRDIYLKYLDQASSGDEYPYIYLAMIAERKGDKQGAVAYYRKALGANPESARVALDLGRAYESLGDARNAGRYFELAANLRPSDVRVLLAVADYYSRSAAVARAIPLLQKVVALRPNDDIYKQRLEQLRERAGFAQ